MNKNQTKKSFLKLMSKLYDVASGYDESELLELAKVAKYQNQYALTQIIDGLILLISDNESGDKISSNYDYKNTNLPKKSRISKKSLYDFFCSKDVFETTADISRSLPFSFPVKDKESRVRYVKRLMNFLSALSNDDQVTLLNYIQDNLSSDSVGGFVSNWSKLIRGL